MMEAGWDSGVVEIAGAIRSGRLKLRNGQGELGKEWPW